jgi:hypothetical protein
MRQKKITPGRTAIAGHLSIAAAVRDDLRLGAWNSEERRLWNETTRKPEI